MPAALVLLLAAVVGLGLHLTAGKHVIALDAGHGGGDPGAVDIVKEAEMTEETVALLFQLLENDPEYAPVLCRDAGEAAARARFANSKNASLYLSVHGNSDATRTAEGFECYPAPPGRKRHRESMKFARYLVEEAAEAGRPIRGENGIRYAYYEPNPDGTLTKVLREESDGEIYSARSFGVVENADCPAVLAEQCFITNSRDVEAFGTSAGCKKAAECYYRAICRYFSTTPVTVADP